MRPLTVITGILLGSCLSIALSLALVVIVFLLLGDDYPRLQFEFRALVESMLIFLVMTVIAAGSFYTLLTDHRWRYLAQVLLWAGIAATTWYYLPAQ